ncbi:MAG: exopolysaccharide biosynthesis polyprenyl glycosylphosphotransferase [bacterium]
MIYLGLEMGAQFSPRYVNILFYRVWCIVGSLIILFFPSYLSWNTLKFWTVKDGFTMLFLVLMVYLISSLIIPKIIRFPRIEHYSIIFTFITLFYLIIISIIAIGRFYYSRSFLLYAYILNLAWLIIASFIEKKRRLNLALLPFSISDELLNIPNINWYILDNPSEISNLYTLDGLVVSSQANLPPEWTRYTTNLLLKGIPIYNISEIYETVLGKIPISYFYEESIKGNYKSLATKFLKRLFDILLVIIISPFVLILSIIIAILIKLDSEGPILFKQTRIGEGGRTYKIIKFRTMHINAEANGPRFASNDDPRVTRIGKILRRFRLDELPQFWNVLKGEMSLIGPRPEQEKFVEEFIQEIPFYNLRHLVKPGITGWAQIHQGYAAGIEETKEKLEYDLYYIKNQSIWLDLVIAFKTIKVLLIKWGAR